MVLRLAYVILVDDKKEVANTRASNFFLCVPSMVQFLSGVSPDTGIYRQV